MTTPKGPEPTTGRTLEPSEFTLKEFGRSRVYPDGYPDDYGQVDVADRDRSKMGEFPSPSDSAHYRSDVDASKQSLHHTLGNSRNQGSQGDHQHDGVTGLKMGPFEFNPAFNPALPETQWPNAANWKIRPQLTVAATAADIRTFLHRFFEFRDV